MASPISRHRFLANQNNKEGVPEFFVVAAENEALDSSEKGFLQGAR